MTKFERNIFEQPGNARIRAELERVVASRVFTQSPHLVSFIRCVVEAVLAGDASRIKAYTIAIDALGRDVAFDPQNDAIVRVEAGRLRRVLAQYYAGDGRDDPIIIEVPRGTYVPVFRTNTLRNRIDTRLHSLWRQLSAPLREAVQAVLLTAALTAATLVAVQAMDTMATTLWPRAASASQAAPPATPLENFAARVER